MEMAIEKELNSGQDGIDLEGTMNNDLKASAMGGERSSCDGDIIVSMMGLASDV